MKIMLMLLTIVMVSNKTYHAFENGGDNYTHNVRIQAIIPLGILAQQHHTHLFKKQSQWHKKTYRSSLNTTSPDCFFRCHLDPKPEKQHMMGFQIYQPKLNWRFGSRMFPVVWIFQDIFPKDILYLNSNLQSNFFAHECNQVKFTLPLPPTKKKNISKTHTHLSPKMCLLK